MEQLMDRQALLQDKIDALGAWEIDTKLEIVMDALELQKAITQSRIYLRGTLLCRLLLQQPDVLLLDEPTNHQSVLWLEQHLAIRWNCNCTHDRYLQTRVGFKLDRGRYSKGNYSSWLIKNQAVWHWKKKVASKRRKT
jgi:ATPase subunit of ABC transporter with duplicated ATPase domains